MDDVDHREPNSRSNTSLSAMNASRIQNNIPRMQKRFTKNPTGVAAAIKQQAQQQQTTTIAQGALLAPRLKRKNMTNNTNLGESENQEDVEHYESINSLTQIGQFKRGNLKKANPNASTSTSNGNVNGMTKKPTSLGSQVSLKSNTSAAAMSRAASTRMLSEKNEDENRSDYMDMCQMRSSVILDDKESSAFFQKWKSHKDLYLNIELIFLILNLLTSLLLLGLAIWTLIDKRFRFIADLSNRIDYTSLSRLIGLLNYLLVSLSSVSAILDVIKLFIYVYVKSFLNSHETSELDKIVVNQVKLTKQVVARDEITETGAKSLQLRGKIKQRINTIKRSLVSLNYLVLFFYVLVFFAPLFFLGLYLHFESSKITEQQLPSSLKKLISEYELQQMMEINRASGFLNAIQSTTFLEEKERNSNAMAKGSRASFQINTQERKIVDKMHVAFACCHYQNPYAYGYITPPSCNYQRGCLKPVQDFLWFYLYFGVIIFLTTASLKLCIQIVLMVNYHILLVYKLINRLYFFESTRRTQGIKTTTIARTRSPADTQQQPEKHQRHQRLLTVNSRNEKEEASDDEEVKQQKRERYERLRREKELLLQEEDEQEEVEKRRRDSHLNRLDEINRRQEEFERKLAEQFRWKELEYERALRRNEVQHLLEMKKDHDELF